MVDPDEHSTAETVESTKTDQVLKDFYERISDALKPEGFDPTQTVTIIEGEKSFIVETETGNIYRAAKSLISDEMVKVVSTKAPFSILATSVVSEPEDKEPDMDTITKPMANSTIVEKISKRQYLQDENHGQDDFNKQNLENETALNEKENSTKGVNNGTENIRENNNGKGASYTKPNIIDDKYVTKFKLVYLNKTKKESKKNEIPDVTLSQQESEKKDHNDDILKFLSELKDEVKNELSESLRSHNELIKNQMEKYSRLMDQFAYQYELNPENDDEYCRSLENDELKTPNDDTQLNTEQSQGKSSSTDFVVLTKQQLDNTVKNAVKSTQSLGALTDTTKSFESRKAKLSKKNEIKREYKLNEKMKFDYFYDYFSSELRSAELLYVIDSSIENDLDEGTKNDDKHLVRDLLINRVSMYYYSKVSKYKDPNEMLEKLKDLKRNEISQSSAHIRQLIYNMKFKPEIENIESFIEKFENLVRSFNELPETPELSEYEIRDAFSHAVKKSISSVEMLEQLISHRSNEKLSYEELKDYVRKIQSKVNPNPHSAVKSVFRAEYKNDRCFKCGANGHLKSDCPFKDQDGLICYQCHEFVEPSHLGNCTARLRRGGPPTRNGRGAARGFRGGNTKQGSNRPQYTQFSRGAYSSNRGGHRGGTKLSGQKRKMDMNNLNPKGEQKRGKFTHSHGGQSGSYGRGHGNGNGMHKENISVRANAAEVQPNKNQS